MVREGPREARPLSRLDRHRRQDGRRLVRTWAAGGPLDELLGERPEVGGGALPPRCPRRTMEVLVRHGRAGRLRRLPRRQARGALGGLVPQRAKGGRGELSRRHGGRDLDRLARERPEEPGRPLPSRRGERPLRLLASEWAEADGGAFKDGKKVGRWLT